MLDTGRHKVGECRSNYRGQAVLRPWPGERFHHTGTTLAVKSACRFHPHNV